jgi:hypothetical protein
MFEQHKITLMEILEGSQTQPMSRYAEWLISTVVLVNCSAVILDSVPEIHAVHKDFFHELEFCFVDAQYGWLFYLGGLCVRGRIQAF